MRGMFKLLSLVCAVILVGLLSDSAPTSAQTCEEACTVIAYGNTVRGSITNDAVSERFAFNGTRGDIISLVMAQLDPSLDPVVEVYFNGALVAANDDYENVNAAITNLVLPQTGTYFIVPSAIGKTGGQYELTLVRQTEFENIVAPPTNQSAARILTGAFGLSDGSALGPGEFQVEWYCNRLGFTTANDSQNWFCNNRDGGTAFTMTQQDFDTICRITYNNARAFALQTGDSQNPAFNWRCYE